MGKEKKRDVNCGKRGEERRKMWEKIRGEKCGKGEEERSKLWKKK